MRISVVYSSKSHPVFPWLARWVDSQSAGHDSVSMDFAIESLDSAHPERQDNVDGSYFRRRMPEDSWLDPYKSLAEQFDLLRVADLSQFPCFFEFRGSEYVVNIRKKH